MRHLSHPGEVLGVHRAAYGARSRRAAAVPVVRPRRARMGVRHLPELSFHIDRSEKINARMDSLLTRMKKRDGKRSGSAAAGEATSS